MKLHLPKMLTAALLAAVTAVGSSAFAENTTFTTTNSSYTNATNYSEYGFVLTLNGARLSTTSDPAGVPLELCDEVNLTSITFSNFRYQTGAGNSAGLVLADSAGKVLALSSNTVTSSGNVTWNFSDTTVDTDSPLYFYFYKANLTTIEVGDTLTTSVLYKDGGGSNGIANYGSSSNYASCGFLGGISSLKNDNYGPKLSIVTSGVPAAQNEYFWKGTSSPAYWNTEDLNWTLRGADSNYTSATTNIVNFNAGGAATNVTVSENITAGTVNVNDNYTFTVADDNSLTIGTLTVANGSKATVAGTGTVALTTFTGDLAIEAGATVNMASGTTVTLDANHQLPVSGEGTFGVTTLKVAGGTHDITNSLKVTGGGNGEGGTNNKLGLNFSGANGTLNLNAGTTTVTGAVYSNQNGTKINIGTGEKEATLVARRIELSDGGSSALHIGAKGKVVITSTNDTNGGTGAYKTTGLLLSEWLGSTTATVDGKLYAQSVGLYTGDAGMTLNVNNGGVVAVKGIATNYAASGHTSSSTINLAEGGKIVLGASGMANCAIAPWTINLNGGEIGITADATLARAMNVAGNVTFNTAKYEWADSGATLNAGEAGGTMTVSGNLTGTGTITKTGDGTLVLSGAANVISNTINLQAGTLSLTGNYDINALASTGDTTYDNGGSQGIAAGNGFKHTTGVVHVVTGGGTLSADTATFTYGAEQHTGLDANGDFVLQGATDYSVLYVNNSDGVVSYNAAWEVAQAQTPPVAITSVVMAADTTLTADKADASITLTVNGPATVAASAATTLNSVTGLGEGQTLTITGTETVTLGSAVTGNKVVVNNGKIDLGAFAHTLAALEITNGSTAVVTGLDSNKGCVSGTISIGAGSVFTVNGHHDAFGYHEDTATQKIVMGGTDSDLKAVLELNPTIQNAGTVTMTTDIEMNGYAAITSTVKGFNTYDCTITAKGVENSIDQMYLRNAVTITVNGEDGELTIGKLQRTPNFDGALTKEGAGKLVFNGTENYLDKAIIVNAGTLALDGTFSIGAIAGTENATYAYADGTVADNGFKTSSTTRTVYTKVDGAAVTVGEDALFMVGEEEVELAADGTATTAAVTDNTRFYVNQGTEAVSKAKEGAAMENIVLAANTGLTVDDNFESAHISVASGTANVEISEDKVLTGTAQNMVLSGEGTYALNTNTVALGNGVTLGDDWAGIVRITDASANSLNFSTLVRGGSTLELKGFSGYPKNWYESVGNITENIKLTDGSNGYAFKSTGNTSNEGHAAVFTGKLSGDGTLQTAANKLGFTFKGDVEAWTGKIQVLSGTPILTFGDSATKVNAAIDRNGNTVALVVNNDATFSAAVDVSSTTLNGAATFAADSTLGAVTINNGGGLTVGENATVNTTSVTASGEATSMSGAGTLVLNQAVNLTAGTLTMSGVYNIDAFEYEGERTIEGGEHAGNGFATEKGSLTVVTKADNTTLVADAASVVRGGNKFSLANDGTVSLNSANYATFYITNLSETVTTAKSKEEESHVALASIHVDADAELTVDQSIDLSLVTAETGAKLNILSGRTVSVGDATTTATIAGEGTYALKSGSNTMPGTLAEGSDWTGTVRLSDVSINNINLNNYGHEGSKVEFNGVTGYFLQSDTTVFAPKLVLEGEGLKLNDGYSTLASGNPKPPTKYTFAGGVSGDGDMTFSHKNGDRSSVTQHLYFTGDVAGWTGSLSVVAGFTVYAQYSGEQTVNSIISRTGGTLNVEVGTGSGASVVTYTKAITSNSLTVNAGATAYVNGGLTTSTITVADGATLAINGNTTLTSAIESAGTVTLTNVALSNAFEAQEGGEKQYFVGSTANYYLGTAYEYLDVVTGTGAANATGTGLTWGDQEALTMAAGQVKVSDHGTASYDTLYIGQDTTTAEIALYDNIGSLTNIVVKNGKLTVAEGDLPQPVDISVSEHGTISGDVAPEEVEIGSGAIAEFTKPVETEAIRFSAAEDGTVKVTNNGDSAAAYSMLNTQQTVEAKTLELLVPEMVMVANDVAVDEIVNAQAGGVLSLTNAESVELKSMTIGEDAIVQMTYKDEEQLLQEGTVTITDTLTAGGGILLANLTMQGGSTLDVAGGDDMALTLGSQFTVDNSTGLVMLDAATLEAIAGLQNIGDTVILIDQYGGTQLTTNLTDGDWARTHFDLSSITDADYKMYVTGTEIGIVKSSQVPEPTTGTLSLLALAALAARRRRK